MIRIIFGLPRVGKTALMTSFALEHMRGRTAAQEVLECNKLVAKLNAGGYRLHPPRNHLVFADYPITDRFGSSYEIDGYNLGLPNESHTTTAFLAPFSNIYLDEAQKYLNSRLSSKLADFVSRFYELHGHMRLNINMTVQRPGLIDLNVRELALEVIEVVELKHEYDCGRIVRSDWVCNVYNSAAAALNYIDSGKRKGSGERKQYSFDGNIFRHYDSFNFMPAFFAGRENADFDLKPSSKCEMTRDGFESFNNTHSYAVPKTYYREDK